MRCPRCASLERLVDGVPARPAGVHLCAELDADIVEHLAQAGPVTYATATATFNTLERNLARVRIYTLRQPFPKTEASFEVFVLTIHRAFLEGTGLYDGGGRFRQEPVVYGPESKRRHGVAHETIGEHLGRLWRRCVPLEPAGLPRGSLATAGARLVHGFLEVHPFPDLNGRTARALFEALVHATGRESKPLPRDQDRSAHQEYVGALQAVDWELDDADERPHDRHYAKLARWLDRFIVEPEEDEPDDPE